MYGKLSWPGDKSAQCLAKSASSDSGKAPPCLRRDSKSLPRSVSREDLGASAEIQAIMQHTLGMQTPPTVSFLGISPPRRQSGAANPLLQGSDDAYLSSRGNLQALREIDARGVSFLKSGGLPGESLDERQIWVGEKGKGEASEGGILPLKRKGESCVKQSCTKAGPAEPLTSQIGFNIA